MAKFYGIIGYVTSQETRPDIWESVVVERPYYGDFTRNTTNRLEAQNEVNGDININNNLSIVADPYAYENFNDMKYMVYMGTKWTIKSVEVQFPRLILTIGGVYHVEDTAGA